MFGFSISWSWFCSCHGKTGDCDAEGGAAQHLAGAYEKEDSTKSSKRRALRNAREFCLLVRRPELPKEEEFFRKKGKGFYRRWNHWLPVGGRGGVARGAVKQAQSAVHEHAKVVKANFRPIRRVACWEPVGESSPMLPALMHLQRWGRKQWQPVRVQRVHDECLHQMPAISARARSVVDPSPVRGELA